MGSEGGGGAAMNNKFITLYLTRLPKTYKPLLKKKKVKNSAQQYLQRKKKYIYICSKNI
jgi:hypothetical protein